MLESYSSERNDRISGNLQQYTLSLLISYNLGMNILYLLSPCDVFNHAVLAGPHVLKASNLYTKVKPPD